MYKVKWKYNWRPTESVSLEQWNNKKKQHHIEARKKKNKKQIQLNAAFILHQRL